MTMSAEFCRAQAAHHHQRAADSPLDNVRRIAVVAAATWEGEAVFAEHRERRRLVARTATEAKPHAGDDSAPGEIPDPGHIAGRASAESTGIVR